MSLGRDRSPFLVIYMQNDSERPDAAVFFFLSLRAGGLLIQYVLRVEHAVPEKSGSIVT